MNKNHTLKTLTVMATLTATMACAPKGFQTQASSSAADQTQSGQGTTTNPPAVTIDDVQMKSLVEDSNNQSGLGGSLAFDFDKVRGEFIIMVPLPTGILFTPSGSFTNYPDITFGPIFDATGKMKVAVRVPVKYVIKGLAFGDPARLPNGDPLPAMPAGQGELPGLALNFPANNTQVHLYIGINALGLFVTLPSNSALPIPFNFTLPLKSQDKTRTFGYLTYVTAKNGFPPGLFISTGVPASFARILEDYFHL